MPRPKSDFETLYPYQLYTPEEILEPDRMYTVPEIARLLQNLDPGTKLDEETEFRALQWTVPWIVRNEESFVINDPVGDEPGYFGLRTADTETDTDTETETAPVDAVGPDPDGPGPNR